MVMFDPHERIIELNIALDNWQQILEENEQIIHQLYVDICRTEEGCLSN